ncbi:hypothetical protein Pcinc_004139 [Petrolisthes cinctipes]|uniref:NIF3-like protein 1 n=1 Tax=Petrolisthes cinctipes TaxID=88211 RepID=A0AAE1L0K7_PETCI|nr:hypothetical protein Pcinc_004139 [Petrolisthes cinctipes]
MNIYLLHQPLKRCLSARFYSMELSAVVKKLEELAPVSLAESWDNVGLLVEPYTKKELRAILLTNDLTEEVVEEAEQRGAGLILSYHPPIFRPLKRITTSSWKGKIVARCLEQGIAIYSPHTACDALKGGVNDWLIKAFDCNHVTPVQQSTKAPLYTHQVTMHLSSDDEALTLGNKLKKEMDPSVSLIIIGGSQVVVQCKERILPDIFTQAHASNCDVATQLSISKLESYPAIGYGMGRKGKLATPITMQEAVSKVKAHLGLPHVRVALAKSSNMFSQVKSVCVCAGSGASVLRGAKADLWLTGEMSHHEVLDATQAGHTVILTDHSNSERGYLANTFCPLLSALLDNNVEVFVSAKDRDPLEVM